MFPIIFSVILFSCLGFFSLPTFKGIKKFRTNKLIFFCSSLYIMLIFGLRNRNVGTDTTEYVAYFLFPSDGYRDRTSDIGFEIFNTIARFFLNDNITGYLLLCSIFSLSGFLFLVHKRSTNYPLTLCCFWTLFTTECMFFWYASMMRQTLSMGFCFLFLYLLDKSNKKATEWILLLLFSIIAISIHASSILPIFIFLISYYIIINEKIILSFLFFAIPITYILGAQSFFTLEKYIPTVMSILGLADDKYGSYADISFGYISQSFFMINMFSLPYTLIALICLFIIKKRKLYTSLNSVVFKSFFIGILLNNLLATNMMWGRLLSCFTMLIFIVFPNCLEKVSIKWKFILFTPFFLLFIKKTFDLIMYQYVPHIGIILYPYKFFN